MNPRNVLPLALIFFVPLTRPATLRAAPFYTDVASFAVPTDARQLLYSPLTNSLVLKNTQSEIVAIDLGTQALTTRFAINNFTDITLSPDTSFLFAADYGGDASGPGTTYGQSYVHRLDLLTKTWELRTAYIAGNVQAVSDTQVLLKSLASWVTFTNNDWGTGSALVVLNTGSGGWWGPGFYAWVSSGDFRYDVRTGRLLHGNSGISAPEITAFRIISNEFVEQEASGVYGSAQAGGGSVALAADGSAFYYGRLQVDVLDVTHNLHLFPELIYAANGDIAFGSDGYYDAHTGGLVGSLPFPTSVFAPNPDGGRDFWAYDPSTTTVHHFAPAPLSYYTLPPCRLLDTRQSAGPAAAAPTLAAGVTRIVSISGTCGIPVTARSLSVNLTAVAPVADGSLRITRGGLSPQAIGVAVAVQAGQTRASNGVLELALDGTGHALVVNASNGPVDMVLDVNGYFE